MFLMRNVTVQQHNLVVCDFSVLIPKTKKRKFTFHIHSWKLRDQAVVNEFKGVFTEKVTATQPNEPAETGPFRLGKLVR